MEALKFRDWKKRFAPNDSGMDYDLRGAFKAGLQPSPENGHWPDTYKKPNHPTFSDQSIYAKDRPDLAGSWSGETYVPHGHVSSAAKPWEKYAAPAAAEQPLESANLIPASRYPSGWQFDSHAGILGMARAAFGDVAGGVGAIGDTARGAPVTTDTVDKVIPLAAAMTPVNPAVRSGDAAIPGIARAMMRQETPAPTAEALRTAGGAGFDQARDMGVDYAAPAVAKMASTVRANLEGDGILDVLAPKTFSIIKQLETPPVGSGASLSGLHAARRAFGHAAKDFANPTEQLAAQRAIDAIDGFITKPPAEGVVAGPAAAAGEVFHDARGNYAASMRSDRLTDVSSAAELKALAANSGRNFDNTLRGKIANLIVTQKGRAGFSPEEVAAIEKISTGNWGRNATRHIGNLLGGGGGLGQAMTGMGSAAIGNQVAGAPGAIVGAAAPVLGVVAKAMANRMTRKAAETADELVRRRSPLYEQSAAGAPMVAAPVAGKAAALRALILALENRHAGGGGY